MIISIVPMEENTKINEGPNKTQNKPAAELDKKASMLEKLLKNPIAVAVSSFADIFVSKALNIPSVDAA